MNSKGRTMASALVLLFFMVCGCVGFAQQASQQVTASITGDNGTQPLVIYYSRSGKALMAATALKNQLGCEMAEIVSKRQIGVPTIMADQLFNRSDEQQPFAKDLKQYNPVIFISPIWFARLSSPVRTFIKQQADLKGKEVYIFTTSGGPMQFKNQAIGDFARDQGLLVKGVFNLKGAMKKTREDFDRDIKEILEKNPIKAAAAVL